MEPSKEKMQVATDSNWIDTSDDKVRKQPKARQKRKVNTTLRKQSAMAAPAMILHASKESEEDEGLPQSELAIDVDDDDNADKVDHADEVDNADEVDDADEVLEHDDANIVNLNSLDKLTSIQILFGHGSYVGITLTPPTQPSPNQLAVPQVSSFVEDNTGIEAQPNRNNHVDDFVDDSQSPELPQWQEVDECLRLNAPSPEALQNDTIFSAVMGLCSLSQNLESILPEVSDDPVSDDPVMNSTNATGIRGGSTPHQTSQYILESQDLS